MDTKLLEEIKQKLLSEKEKLEKELEKFSHKNTNTTETDYESDFPSLGDKEDENATEVAAYSDRLSLEDALEKSLRDINAALVRIKDDTYGICKYCKQEIGPKRLQARPASSACIACKKTLTQEI